MVCCFMNVDMKAMKELIPTLLISLCGLFLMSTTLYDHIDRDYAQPMHYLFILNSMLCFKNNIELNYADMMSSSVKKARAHRGSISSVDLIEYVFDSGLKMFFISLSFGILIGVCSNYKNVLEMLLFNDLYKNFILIVSTILSSFFAGACSCISTFICVIICIFMSISFRFDSDNIVLPIIASMSDYICTMALNYFSENIFMEAFQRYPFLIDNYPSGVLRPDVYRQIFATNCALMVITVSILGVLYYHSRNKCNLRLFSAWSLSVSFAITMLAGHIINLVSQDNMWLGCIIPLFNGISGSIILIYVGKLTTFINSKGYESDGSEVISISSYEDSHNEESVKNPKNTTTLCTITITSFCLSVVSCLLLKFFFVDMPSFYIFIFGVLLNLEVFLLYHMVNAIVSVLQYFKMDISYHIVPLLNALSDLLGICLLGGAVFLIT
ncbi:solute carrier family 41 [Nematocida minor]|uniref:solute carrier family 41 n=1 Tax=Nematocida minor TaxID=1912983 RepID=UPI0022201759|nr:solute carrier family 41 [Nematocida minor]KAI5191428.1 solute carrier family 41 [Nematocida minor]